MYFCVRFQQQMKKMKRTHYILAALLTLCLGVASCGSSDSEEVVLSEQCYISAFSLGQMKRVLHATASDGKDSTYHVAFSGSLYKLLIDQRAQTITNRDSLPIGTRLESVLATVTGTGNLVYAPVADTTNWKTYSTKDSINFTEPLLFRVYSSSGKTSRDYTLKLNVRTSNPEGFSWTRMADIHPSSDVIDEARLLFVEQGPMVFFKDATGKVFVEKANSYYAETWTELECTGLGAAPEVKTIHDFLGKFWMSCDQKLYTSSDGVAWQEANTEGITPLHLIAASETALYVTTTDADGAPIIASSADGTSWTPIEVEAGGFTGHPAAALAYEQDNGNRRVILLDNVSGGAAPLSVWSLLEGSSEPWTLFAQAGDNDYLLPAQHHLTIVEYYNSLVAMGGSLLGSDTSTALKKAYVSHDNGITWKTSSDFVPPTAIQGTTGAVAVARRAEFIWVVAGNQVWCAKKNSIGE